MRKSYWRFLAEYFYGKLLTEQIGLRQTKAGYVKHYLNIWLKKKKLSESPIQDFIPQNTHYSYQIEHWNLLDVVTFHNAVFMYKF